MALKTEEPRQETQPLNASALRLARALLGGSPPEPMRTLDISAAHSRACAPLTDARHAVGEDEDPGRAGRVDLSCRRAGDGERLAVAGETGDELDHACDAVSRDNARSTHAGS